MEGGGGYLSEPLVWVWDGGFLPVCVIYWWCTCTLWLYLFTARILVFSLAESFEIRRADYGTGFSQVLTLFTLFSIFVVVWDGAVWIWGCFFFCFLSRSGVVVRLGGGCWIGC